MVAATAALSPTRALHRPRRLDARALTGIFLAVLSTVGALVYWSVTSDTREVLVSARAEARRPSEYGSRGACSLDARGGSLSRGRCLFAHGSNWIRVLGLRESVTAWGVPSDAQDPRRG